MATLDPVLVGDVFQHREEFLKQGPAAPGVDHVLVFLQGGGVELGPLRLGAAQIFLRQQPAEQGAIGQKCNPVIMTERRHPRFGPTIDQRVLHLVRDDADAVICDDAQPLGVEIGQGEVANLAFVTQIGEMLERVEVAFVAVIPPMELEQVETVDTHSAPRDADRFLDGAPCHPAGIRHPFGERLDLRQPLGSAARGEPAPELADQILGRAVMIGEVPAGESGIVIGEHRLDRARRVDGAMGAGNLPHPVEDAA